MKSLIDEVNKKYKGSGSTFVGAIVGEKFTHIASIGDSRGYIVGNNDELYQITDDDSPEYIKWKKNWSMYQNGLGRNLSSDEYKDKISDDDKEAIKKAVADAKEVLEKNADDKEKLEEASKALSDTIMPIGAKLYQQAGDDKKDDEKSDDKKADGDTVEGEVVDK